MQIDKVLASELHFRSRFNFVEQKLQCLLQEMGTRIAIGAHNTAHFNVVGTLTNRLDVKKSVDVLQKLRNIVRMLGIVISCKLQEQSIEGDARACQPVGQRLPRLPPVPVPGSQVLSNLIRR